MQRRVLRFVHPTDLRLHKPPRGRDSLTESAEIDPIDAISNSDRTESHPRGVMGESKGLSPHPLLQQHRRRRDRPVLQRGQQQALPGLVVPDARKIKALS